MGNLLTGDLTRFIPAMPIFEDFRFMERAWSLGGFDGFRQKQEYARVYPGLAPRRVNTYILLI
jgi:hypothetical protein